MPSPAEFLVENGGIKAHASPSVRRYARELGVDVGQVKGHGTQRPHHARGRSVLRQSRPGRRWACRCRREAAALNLLPWPQVDFAKFGQIEVKPLSRIKKISGPNLARNWVMIPAVTYHEDADITDLEAFRVQLNKENEKSRASRSPCSPS